MNRYTRDMRGYGATPPHANWPNKAKIAVQFVINYEEGGENCLLHGDTASEAFLSEIVGAAHSGKGNAIGIWKAFMSMAHGPDSGACTGCLPNSRSQQRSMALPQLWPAIPSKCGRCKAQSGKLPAMA